MADNSANKAGPDTAAAGIPFYEKQRQHLKELIGRKRALEKRIVRHFKGFDGGAGRKGV